MNAEFDSRKEDLARRKSAIADLQLRLNIASNLSAAERDDLTRRIDQQTANRIASSRTCRPRSGRKSRRFSKNSERN